MDIAVTNFAGNSVTVLLGNGDGTFTPAASPSTGNSTAIAVGDFNGDGKPDLAVANPADATVVCCSAMATARLPRLLHRGDWCFNPDSMVVGDVNGDGKTGPRRGELGDSTVSVLPGNGDGTFAPAPRASVGTNPVGLVVGDFNGDGKPDVATANSGSPSATVLLGSPTTVATCDSLRHCGMGRRNSQHRRRLPW